jgi:hypothetical protein
MEDADLVDGDLLTNEVEISLNCEATEAASTTSRPQPHH